jgi:hypothetical protein
MRKDSNGQAVVAVLATILGLILIVGIAVGGYQLNWWLKGQAVNRNAKINRTSYEVQQTYREEVFTDMSKVRAFDAQIEDPAYKGSVPQLRAARIAQIRTTCDHIARLMTSGAGVDPDVTAFHDRECF